MLKTPLLHPEVLSALASAGHGSRVLIADGNFPTANPTAGSARRVYLNFAPRPVSATDVLGVLVEVVNVEAATAMEPPTRVETSILAEFRQLLGEVPITVSRRTEFYELSQGKELALVVATGETRIYANLLLTIGVVAAPQTSNSTDTVQQAAAIQEPSS